MPASRNHQRTRPEPKLPSLLPAGMLLVLLCALSILWGSLTSGDSAQETVSPSVDPILSIPTVNPIPTDHPFQGSWWLVLVNQHSLLPAGSEPAARTEIRSEMEVDSRIAVDLQSMLDGARQEGLDPLVCAAYRTHQRQQELFDAKIQTFLDQGLSQQEAEAQASLWVAPPDASEHQTGLAVDIVSTDYQILDEAQAETPLQKWLMAHCAEYGFVLRYPPEKSEITGITFEPWHYRYVGRSAAQEMTEKGLCLEEYWQQAGQVPAGNQ